MLLLLLLLHYNDVNPDVRVFFTSNEHPVAVAVLLYACMVSDI